MDLEQRDPGPIWGGWWFWEPPPGRTKEMVGFFSRLTPEQKKAALSCRDDGLSHLSGD